MSVCVLSGMQMMQCSSLAWKSFLNAVAKLRFPSCARVFGGRLLNVSTNLQNMLELFAAMFCSVVTNLCPMRVEY